MSLIDQAFDAFESGDLAAAAALCGMIVNSDPENFGAHYLIGSIYGLQNQWNHAADHLERATHIRPDFAGAFFNLANVRHELRQFPAALEAVIRACELRHEDDEAWVLRSNLERQLDQTCAAKASASVVLDRNPASSNAWMALGSALLVDSKPEEALKAHERAIALDPSSAMGHSNRGNALLILNRLDEALEAIDQSLRLDPTLAYGWDKRALVLTELYRYEEALQACHQSRSFAPNQCLSWRNEADILRRMQRHKEALAACDASLSIQADHAETLLTRGIIFQEMGDLTKAIADYETVRTLRDDYPEADFNRSLSLLALGDFERAWTGYERRFDLLAIKRHALGHQTKYLPHTTRAMDARGLHDRKVLILEEQGVGDTIMFSSILRDLTEVTDKVTIALNSRLSSLLRRSFPQLHFHPLEELRPEKLQEYDCALFIGSLGYTFRRNREKFRGEPYLQADPARVARWKARLPKDGRKIIGISWRGGTRNTNEATRSLTLPEFSPLFAQGHHFVSLQYGDRRAELNDFCKSSGVNILHFAPEETENLDDLASLIVALDSVVTVQNTNVHLAGALGTSCFAIIPHAPEWRYGRIGSKMDWYDSVELFRRDNTTSLEALISDIAKKTS